MNRRTPYIPESLAAVVRKAMAFDRDQRYWSVPEFQAEITAYQAGFATAAERAGPWKQAVLFVRRNRAVSIATAAALAPGSPVPLHEAQLPTAQIRRC